MKPPVFVHHTWGRFKGHSLSQTEKEKPKKQKVHVGTLIFLCEANGKIKRKRGKEKGEEKDFSFYVRRERRNGKTGLRGQMAGARGGNPVTEIEMFFLSPRKFVGNERDPRPQSSSCYFSSAVC